MEGIYCRDNFDWLLSLHILNFQVIRISLNFLVDWLRGGAIQFFGTKRHHDKWLKDTEDYVIKGCFSMTELGHGSNVCESCMSVYYITLESKILSIVSAILTDIFASTVQVRGIETVTTYDSSTGEFVINTPCESAQKYWIGGAANVTILPL